MALSTVSRKVYPRSVQTTSTCTERRDILLSLQTAMSHGVSSSYRPMVLMPSCNSKTLLKKPRRNITRRPPYISVSSSSKTSVGLRISAVMRPRQYGHRKFLTPCFFDIILSRWRRQCGHSTTYVVSVKKSSESVITSFSELSIGKAACTPDNGIATDAPTASTEPGSRDCPGVLCPISSSEERRCRFVEWQCGHVTS